MEVNDTLRSTEDVTSDKKSGKKLPGTAVARRENQSRSGM
jgi:hypothetical protein